MDFNKIYDQIRNGIQKEWIAGKDKGATSYQNLYGFNLEGAERQGDQRWELIKKYLPQHYKSAVDLGSNNGYFIFKICKLTGAYGIGLEASHDNVQLSRLISCLNSELNTAFIHMNLSLDTVKNLPTADVYLCLSMFQHVIIQHGLEKSKIIMKEICAKTNYMFFEIAEPSEPVGPYQEKLSFMGDDPETWVTEFLFDSGFNNVENLGRLPVEHLKGAYRTIFLASK